MNNRWYAIIEIVAWVYTITILQSTSTHVVVIIYRVLCYEHSPIGWLFSC